MSYHTFGKLSPGEIIEAVEGYYELSIGGLVVQGLSGDKHKLDPSTKKGKEKVEKTIDRLFGNKKE